MIVDNFTSTPEPAQKLLDELHQVNIPALFVEELPSKGRKAAVKVARQKLRHIKGQIRFEKEAIKTQWDSRKKNEALAENLYLLPYLTLEKLVSQLEIDIAELEAASETGAPIPEVPSFGSILYGQQVDDGARVEFQWEVITSETLAQRQEVLAAQTRGNMIQARALIQQKQYAQARALLRRTDHPKAREWLVKLDEVDPPYSAGAAMLNLLSQDTRRRSRRDSAMKSVAFLIWFLVLIAVIIVAMSRASLP